jgi:hypothetical protein
VSPAASAEVKTVATSSAWSPALPLNSTMPPTISTATSTVAVSSAMSVPLRLRASPVCSGIGSSS